MHAKSGGFQLLRRHHAARVTENPRFSVLRSTSSMCVTLARIFVLSQPTAVAPGSFSMQCNPSVSGSRAAPDLGLRRHRILVKTLNRISLFIASRSDLASSSCIIDVFQILLSFISRLSDGQSEHKAINTSGVLCKGEKDVRANRLPIQSLHQLHRVSAYLQSLTLIFATTLRNQCYDATILIRDQGNPWIVQLSQISGNPGWLTAEPHVEKI